MKTSALSMLCPLLVTLVLCSCATTQSSDEQRKAICNEIKSKLTFNGNTSNNREAEIQDSENALLQRQYEKNHCDEI
jgi:hypothetical protein